MTAPVHPDSDNSGNNMATKKSTAIGKKKRKTGEKGPATIGVGTAPTPKSLAWKKLTQEALWKSIGDDSEAHFGVRIPADWYDLIDSFIKLEFKL